MSSLPRHSTQTHAEVTVRREHVTRAGRPSAALLVFQAPTSTRIAAQAVDSILAFPGFVQLERVCAATVSLAASLFSSPDSWSCAAVPGSHVISNEEPNTSEVLSLDTGMRGCSKCACLMQLVQLCRSQPDFAYMPVTDWVKVDSLWSTRSLLHAKDGSHMCQSQAHHFQGLLAEDQQSVHRIDIRRLAASIRILQCA